jgi:hypothetical protein
MTDAAERIRAVLFTARNEAEKLRGGSQDIDAAHDMCLALGMALLAELRGTGDVDRDAAFMAWWDNPDCPPGSTVYGENLHEGFNAGWDAAVKARGGER